MPSVHNKLMEHYLKQRMQKLLGSHFDANKWKELVKSYTYNRYYHTLSHIGYALNVLDMIKEPYFDKIPYVAIELAIFYHDYYCSGNTDDEKLSAKKAVADYGYLTDKKLLSDLILATAQDYKAPDHWPIRELANVMRDIDYAILYDKANYGWYSLGICLEASLIFDIEKYIEKRAEFLKKASDMTFLCHTPRLTKNFGDAQNNIRNEYAYWLNL